MTPSQSPLEGRTAPRLIAFYLPQFHPIKENDLWWGKGFTEWTNATKARPLFKGHYQPHLPSDLGFYDLRLPETRREQIKMAKQYGVDGFCYHYYWFSGKRILNKPLDDMLMDPESDMPFCLCWANENWTRRWDASENEILIEQKYQPDDDLNFIKSVIPFFEDPRYIRVDDKPYMIVYRPQQLPDARRSMRVWREYCKSVGLGEIHICAALTHGNEDYSQFGCDSGVEFPPHNLREVRNVNDKINFFDAFRGNVVEYASVAEGYLNRAYSSERVFKTVFPSWDNTARLGENAMVIHNGTPKNYQHWLSSTIEQVQQGDESDNIVFINAWNEWAEGCHLEPDHCFGRGFLRATLDAKNGLREFATFPDVGVPDIVDDLPRSFWKDMGRTVGYHVLRRLDSTKLVINRRPWLHRALRPLYRFLRYSRLIR